MNIQLITDMRKNVVVPFITCSWSMLNSLKISQLPAGVESLELLRNGNVRVELKAWSNMVDADDFAEDWIIEHWLQTPFPTKAA